jgi:regulator of sigma E protease
LRLSWRWALLIAVHEYGHYRVAVACGVKVLRFSVGFGKTPAALATHQGSPTEFVIAAFPLGGYVRMLDEREAPVRRKSAIWRSTTSRWRCGQPLWRQARWSTSCWRCCCMRWSTGAAFSSRSAVLASPVPGSIAQR